MTGLFLDVLNLSISVGWLILAVLGLRLLMKRAPKWVNVLLWGIVAVRLVCPFTIESALSLIPSAETIPLNIEMDTTPAIHSGVAFIDSSINPGIAHSNTPTAGASVNPLQITMAILANVWILGMAAMALYTAFSYISLQRKLRTAVILRDNIYQCETVQSPFVLGILKPKIYLPYGMEDPYVIAHEMAHIRRKDHWWKPLGFLLLSIHWFNPLMWLAYVLLCRDIELACDEKVIAELDSEQRADYTQALVACSVNRRSIAACPLAFGEVGVKERVKSIMNYRKPTFWILLTALAVCAAVAVCFLTDPKLVPEFAMSGNNISDLEPEQIVERIVQFQDIENSDVYVNASGYSLSVDADFDWMDSQTISYFFYENHEVRNAQLRIFPESKEYFLTEANEWPDQNRIFLLRNYLDAVKFLPQEAIREMAPADRYLIEHIDEGTPSDYDRVITYSAAGVGDTEGWYLHLRVLPLHSDGEQYSGTGEEVVHLFYGNGRNTAVGLTRMWFDYTEDNSEMSYEQELTTRLEEFPDVTFCYVPGELTAETADGVRTRLFDGMPIWSVYFCDLNGDGYPEICSESSFGSGIIDERITVYDYANGRSYLLSGRGEHDYFLRLDSRDGQLYVDKRVYNSSELVSSEPLRLEDFTIQIDTQPRVTLTARILEIRDGYFLVEPLDGSEGPDRIEVPIQNMASSPEPQVGDTLQIEYDGMLQETYPVRIASVYHISVAQRSPMVPTDTELTGLHAGVLLVPMDGSIYRYNLRESDPQNVTADELLLCFEEIDMGETVDNQVFSLKEYPERTKVLLISERNGALLCEYSPPLRCSESALNDAIASGFVVEENGLATHGQDIWREFYEKTCQGTESSVTVASYHTLDPERCTSEYWEIFRQDYPFLNICELQFDGSQFILIDNGGCGVYSYEYLMKYETPINSILSYREPEYAYRYVLTHDNRATYDELWQSAASSQYGAYIEHFPIYSELKTD